MERLTKIDGIGQNDLIRCFGCDEEKSGPNLENCGWCEDGWRKALDRLAAYEDTGYSPEEISALVLEVQGRRASGDTERYLAVPDNQVSIEPDGLRGNRWFAHKDGTMTFR